MRCCAAVFSLVFVLVGTDACSVAKSTTPTCAAGFCLADNLPSESDVRAVFGGSGEDLGRLGTRFCYQSESPNRKIYVAFVEKDLGEGRRLVSIRASSTNFCKHLSSPEEIARYSTREGVGVGDSERKVVAVYGPPTMVISPPPLGVVEEFFGSSKNAPVVERIAHYGSSDPADPLTATFYYASGEVVGIEISADE